MRNRISELPWSSQYEIVSYLDAKAKSCFSAASVGARQLTSIKSEDDTVTLYAYIMISKHFRKTCPKPYLLLDLAQIMEEQGDDENFRFYQSQELAEKGVNAHSWYKYYKEYLIVSYKVSRAILQPNETSEVKLSSALNASSVPFFILQKGYRLTIYPQHLKVVDHVEGSSRYDKFQITLPDEKIEPVIDEASNLSILNALQTTVYSAQRKYQKWFQNKSCIKLSIFHHHGTAGQQRAMDLNKRMQACRTLQDALQLLKDHLDRREGCFKNRGRLYNHSFDTYLLNQIAQSGTLAEQFGIESWNRLCDTKENRKRLRENILNSEGVVSRTHRF